MGFTFFARYKTTIDYHAHQMTFEPIDYQVRDLLKELPDRLLGPKVTRRRVLAPSGVYGLRPGEPTGGLDSPGVPIAQVLSGSPADRAGLKAGDVLISFDGRWTTSIADVFDAAADVEPGRETTIVIRRDGKEQTLGLCPTDGA
jgi:S1-C subfamily serine protease